MSKQVLSKEQMQHLKELGVDTSGASMCWVLLPPKPYLSFYNNEYPKDDNKVILALSLQDIWDILPKEITPMISKKIRFKLWLGHNALSYANADDMDDVLIAYYHTNGINVIDAAYGMLCWCAENGYIKTDKKEE